jgi:hypothetical protein
VANAVPPPPADAVRVWRGFRSPQLPLQDFYERLNTVFIPATVEMQIAAGLVGYIPCIAAGLPGKPETAPDETAILFWESQQTYADGFKTLGVRTYTLTHGAVYTAASGAAFPTPLTLPLQLNQPHELGGRPLDWMHEPVCHLIGARPETLQASEFAEQVALAIGHGKATAIICLGNDHVVYWEAGTSDERRLRIARLARCCSWTHEVEAKPTSLQAGLWDEWPGVETRPGDCLNIQFRRRGLAR